MCPGQNRWFFLLKVHGNKTRQWCSELLTYNSFNRLRVTPYNMKIFKAMIVQEHLITNFNKGQKQKTFR